MAREGAAGDAAFGFSADSLADAAVEAFNEPVGLRPIRSGQTVIDAVVGADEIERVMTGSAPGRLVLHIDGKAVGELGAVVGQDGVNAMREVDQEALEKARRSLGVAPWMDLDIDIAGGAVDRDEGLVLSPAQGRQMLEVEVNEPDTGLFEEADTGPGRLLALTDPVTLQAAMDGTARQAAINATPHHLDDIVQRQLQCCSQFADQRLFHCRQVRRQPVRPVRAVAGCGPAAPTANGGFADAKFTGQLRHRLPAALDVGPDFRSGRGIGVQVQFHDARRSPRYAMPCSTPIPPRGFAKLAAKVAVSGWKAAGKVAPHLGSRRSRNQSDALHPTAQGPALRGEAGYPIHLATSLCARAGAHHPRWGTDHCR